MYLVLEYYKNLKEKEPTADTVLSANMQERIFDHKKTAQSLVMFRNTNGRFSMKKKEDKETRYYIDLDLRTRKILNWDYDQRDKLVQKLKNPSNQRVFITKGQYNNLEKRNQELRSGTAKKT